MKFALTPDSIFHARQSRQNADIRARLQTVGQETITGRRSDVVQATQGRVGEAFLLEKASSDITRQRSMADLASARVSGTASSISTIRETVLEFASSSRVTLAQEGVADLVLVSETSFDNLSHVMSALNSRSGSRYLFGGTQSANSPLASANDLTDAIKAQISGAPDTATAIAAIDDYFNQPGGAFETDTYSGSAAEGPRLHVTDSKSFDPLPKANDQVFRDVMQGMALIAAAQEAPNQADQIELMEAGLSFLDRSSSALLSLESRIGAAQQGIERVDQNLEREFQLVSTAQNQMLGRDVFDAAAELQALEGQLEASYTVTGRLGSLSLVNFLR